MNCKYIAHNIIDFIDNNLDKKTCQKIENHITTCQNCSELQTRFQTLFNAINTNIEEVSDAALKADFEAMLAEEKMKIQILKIPSIAKSKKLWKIPLQVAATLTLMLTCYFYGRNEKNNSHYKEMVFVKKEKSQMQTIATLSLIENESASKRLQAVNYAKALIHPDSDILNVLITKMNNDKHVNVRLAAANALSKFTANNKVRLALIKTLEIEKNANMQIELIQILVDIEDRRAIPIMKKLLKKTDTPAYIKEQINLELKQLI
jgi:hypothetical protein